MTLSEFPEKRSFVRYALWFPVTLVLPPSERASSLAEVWAICRDASASGMQVSAASLLTAGQEVTARFRLEKDARDHVSTARVVRTEANDGELMLAFPFRIALRFSEPLAGLPDELRQRLGLEGSG